MAGGQGFTASAGTLVGSVTLALVGLAIAVSTGTVTPNNQDEVPITGQSVAVEQGSPVPTYTRALTGVEITSGHGSLAVTLRPTDPVGLSITTSAGTVTPQGSGVTVNLSGVEAAFSQGFVTGGTQFLSGLAATSQQTAPAVNLELPLSGVEIVSAVGTLSPAQEADDTLITSSAGTVLAELSLELSGVEITSEQGTLTITSDAEIALTGEEITSAAGDIAFEQSFPISGVEITVAQETLGAPGGATLTGLAITVSAGDVFTTNDRTYALTGQSIAVEAGITFASSLAFVTGQELQVEIQGIGPRTVELVGAEISAETGYLGLPPVRHKFAASPRRYYTYKGKRYHVTLDELARLIRADRLDITREDIVVEYGNKKPHKISKQTFAELSVIAAAPPSDDDEDIEAIIALL